MANFMLIIDGVNFSDCVQQQTDIFETPQYVEGPNGGMSKVGTPIWDRVNTLYHFEQPLKPLPKARLVQLARACEPNEVTLTYQSFLQASPRTVKAQLTISRTQFGVSGWNGDIYYGGTLAAEIKDA